MFSILELMSARAAVAENVAAAFIRAAVDDAGRPEADRRRDTLRKPVDTLEFSGVRPGDRVAVFPDGDGYYTRLLCKAVGDAGHVYAMHVVPIDRSNSSSAIDFTGAAVIDTCSNVTRIELKPRNRHVPESWSASEDPGVVYEYVETRPGAESFASPEPLDLIWLSDGYHALYTDALDKPNVSRVNKAMLQSLSTGGLLIVEDHVAKGDVGANDTDRLHRIDIELVKREVIAAGFVFAGASGILRSRLDAHVIDAHALGDISDRFLLKFRKP